MSAIDNPFDGEASRLVKERGASEQDARDVVVLRYLVAGNTEALAHWLMTDYRPGRAVARFLSLMMQPVRVVDGDPAKTMTISFEQVPFELVARRRDGSRGRKADSVFAERNRAISDCYKALVEQYGPGSSDAAIMELAVELGPEISSSTVVEATKKRSPKSPKGKK